MWFFVCIAVAKVAIDAAQLVAIVLSLLAWVLNTLVQFLLRRFINVQRLQLLLDAATRPGTALGIARRAKQPSDEPGNIVSVPWAHDSTIAQRSSASSFN